MQQPQVGELLGVTFKRLVDRGGRLILEELHLNGFGRLIQITFDLHLLAVQTMKLSGIVEIKRAGLRQ